jgi:ketosteroid isomerase-like protein
MKTLAEQTTQAIDRFNQAFQLHDAALLLDLIAEDCVLENTQPAPNGSRHVGREACLALWQGIAGNRDGWFELENTEVFGETALIFWRYCWGEGEQSSVRGVNVMRVRDGKIVEGRGYVKG